MKCVSYTRTMPWKNHKGELTIADQNQRIAEYLAEHKEMDLQKKYSDRKGVENASAAFDKMIDDAGVRLKTYSGLPFTYEIRKGRNGQYTKELWIDRRENSKSLAWSSVLLALGNIKKVGEVVERPKALGDIRGVTYIYGMFYRFGLINVPDEAKEKMKKAFGKSF